MAYSVQRNHPLVRTDDFTTVEDLVLHLIHRKAYEHASAICKCRAVLDWGCNNGYGLPLLAKTATRVGGVDTNELCIQEARLLHPEYANDISLYDGRDIPRPEQNWDAVVSFQVIEHVQDVNAYLEAIRSVLNDKGIALFTTPNREIRLDEGMQPWNEFHVTEFSAPGLAAVLGKHFRYVEVFGLQGDAEIVSIERNRCSRARRAARNERADSLRTLRYFRGAMKKTIRSVVPFDVMVRLRHLYHPVPSEPKTPRLDDSANEHFSTSQLHYTKDDLMTAVDLFAVCSNTEIG